MERIKDLLSTLPLPSKCDAGLHNETLRIILNGIRQMLKVNCGALKAACSYPRAWHSRNSTVTKVAWKPDYELC